MGTASAFSGLMQMSGGWGFALAALGLISSWVPVIWVSYHRRKVLLARVDKDRLQIESERDVRLRELDHRHVERMFELEANRVVEMREQERLTQTSELAILMQLSESIRSGLAPSDIAGAQALPHKTEGAA
ncbi:MAG: hypothetical protein ACJ8ER_11800 [Allosphingosinicella sp.]